MHRTRQELAILKAQSKLSSSIREQMEELGLRRNFFSEISAVYKEDEKRIKDRPAEGQPQRPLQLPIAPKPPKPPLEGKYSLQQRPVSTPTPTPTPQKSMQATTTPTPTRSTAPQSQRNSVRSIELRPSQAPRSQQPITSSASLPTSQESQQRTSSATQLHLPTLLCFLAYVALLLYLYVVGEGAVDEEESFCGQCDERQYGPTLI